MLTAREFHLKEPLPLHAIHAAILEFCSGRADALVYGAQAVNIHVDAPRMTQDVDILATDAAALARELAAELGRKFHAAIRVRELSPALAYRVYQVRRDAPRHLADVRQATFAVEDAVVHGGVRYAPLTLLVALKARAYSKRGLSPKGATDLADLRRLLLAHPELREAPQAVAQAISAIGGDAQAHEAWAELLRSPLVPDDDPDGTY